jgi:hypothetical protein
MSLKLRRSCPQDFRSEYCCVYCSLAYRRTVTTHQAATILANSEDQDLGSMPMRLCGLTHHRPMIVMLWVAHVSVALGRQRVVVLPCQHHPAQLSALGSTLSKRIKAKTRTLSNNPSPTAPPNILMVSFLRKEGKLGLRSGSHRMLVVGLVPVAMGGKYMHQEVIRHAITVA